MGAATFHAAKGVAAMRIDEKHFEQVPLEVVEKILREAASLEKKPDQSPALDSLIDRQDPTELVKEKGDIPSKNSQ
jgi:hypothetical protein